MFFSQRCSGVRGQICHLPQLWGRHVGIWPARCQPCHATSLLLLSPGPPGLPEVPQQHPRDGGPVGEWGEAEACALLGVLERALKASRARGGQSTTWNNPSPLTARGDVTQWRARAVGLAWVPRQIHHVSPRVSGRAICTTGTGSWWASTRGCSSPRSPSTPRWEALPPPHPPVPGYGASPGVVSHQQKYYQQLLFCFCFVFFSLFQSILSSPQASKCRMRCWKRPRGRTWTTCECPGGSEATGAWSLAPCRPAGRVPLTKRLLFRAAIGGL